MKDDRVYLEHILEGEAAKQLSEDLRAEHPDVPWRAMARMRDRLIHAYFGVDWSLVWQAATDDVPRLEARVDEILRGSN